MKPKFLAISVDNATNNDSFIDILIQKYPGFTKEHHIRCFAHVLNLASQEVMKEQDERIVRLRNLIREFRLSPLKMKSLEDISKDLQMEGQFVKPILDVPTRWNSTFDMLKRALRLKGCLSNYSNAIPSEDWDFFEDTCSFLEPFKECTLMVRMEIIQGQHRIWSFTLNGSSSLQPAFGPRSRKT